MRRITRLNPHKDGYGNDCYGRTGYVVDQEIRVSHSHRTCLVPALWLSDVSRRSRASIYRYAGGIPTDESFNGKFRDECLSLQWFRNGIVKLAVVERAGTRDRDLNLESGGDCDCIPNEERATSELSMMRRSHQVTANVEKVADESMHG